MDRPAYSSYRIYATRRIGGGTGIYAISQWRMFDGLDGSGVDVLQGGTASASSVYGGGYEASKAIDADAASRWASKSTPTGTPVWIRCDLPEPRAARSVFISLSASPDNGPADFILQGSNDGGSTWLDVLTVTDFATVEEITAGKTANLEAYGLSGIAQLADGTPASRVLVYSWETGALERTVFPEVSGNWAVTLAGATAAYLVVITGPTEFRPQAHGPVMPERLT